MIFIVLVILFVLGLIVLLILLGNSKGFFPMRKMRDEDFDKYYENPRKIKKSKE